MMAAAHSHREKSMEISGNEQMAFSNSIHQSFVQVEQTKCDEFECNYRYFGSRFFLREFARMKSSILQFH